MHWTKKAWCWPRWISTIRGTEQSVSNNNTNSTAWHTNSFCACAISSKSGRQGLSWPHCFHWRQNQQAGNCAHLSNSRQRLFAVVHVCSFSFLVSLPFPCWYIQSHVWVCRTHFVLTVASAYQTIFTASRLRVGKIPVHAQTGQKFIPAVNSPKILKVCDRGQNLPNNESTDTSVKW